MRNMRLVRLTILVTFLSICRDAASLRHTKEEYEAEQRGQLDVSLQPATVPGKLTPHDGSHNPVNGPITAESSASGVDKTADMEVMDSSPDREGFREGKLDKPNTVLTGDGGSDEVQGQQLTEEKVDGSTYWVFKDLWHPVCRNCKAILDYKWILNEYGYIHGIKPLLVFAMFTLIWILGTTARDFFVPPLLYWAQRLQLSPELAGATLLAFGNSAPDIFSVVTAARKDDMPLAVSEMLGSNMFGLCITGSLVAVSCWYYRVLPSSELQMAAGSADTTGNSQNTISMSALVTTVGFYFLTITILVFVLLEGQATVAKTLCLPLVYMAYVATLWWFRDQKEIMSADAPAESQASEAPLLASGEGGTGDALANTDQPPLEGITMPKDAGPVDIVIWWFALPAYVLRYACIPAVDGSWGAIRRATSAFTPIGMVAFCLIANVGWMQDMNLVALGGFVMIAFVCGLSIFFGSNSQPTLPWFYPIMALFALAGSIIWLAVLASEITALVEAIGFTLGIPRLRLGYTAVAWGNCLTDLLVCLATVQKGHAAMAITALFAAPLIDDLIAFGVSLIVVAWEKHSIPVLCGPHCPKEFKDPLITSLAFITVAIILLSCALKETGSRVKIWAGCLVALYVAFLIIVLFVEHVDAPQAKTLPTKA